MCGISGMVAVQGALSVEEIDRMTRVITHRGPDDHGYLAYDNKTDGARFAREARQLNGAASVLLGHRRLSILDLSEAGRCPMSYADGRLWITYNGEVYNYIELREELKGLGYHFRTHTDTEVILAAYHAWGPECLHRFNGMWAFALLDIERSVLFCARDRLGVKPFYYHWDGKIFSFGSEIKQLVALDRVGRKADAGTLFDFLAFDTYGCNSARTFFRDIHDLRGGHFLHVPLDRSINWKPRAVRWWDLDLRRKELAASDVETADRYRELFTDAVRLRLRSDVPVGSCLSGGLDSSGIVAVTDRLLRQAGAGQSQKTFTSISDNPVFDEREYAQAVINATRVEPHFVTPTPERLVSDLDRLIWHQDEPFTSTSIFAGWCVYGLARENGVTVTLDGQGPDEMMGGYVPMMYPAHIAADLSNFRIMNALRSMSGIRRLFAFSWSRIGLDVAREFSQGFIHANRLPAVRAARELFEPDFFESGRADSEWIKARNGLRMWRKQAGGDRFDQRLYAYTTSASLPGILRQVDRNSMAFSIEARLPFLDYRLVEFSFALSNDEKLRAGVSKQVFRRALDGVIPDMIRDRKSKLGFVTEEPEWLRNQLRDIMLETFNQIPDGSPYRRDVILRRFKLFLAGQAPFSSFFWKIFCSERWRMQFSVEWR